MSVYGLPCPGIGVLISGYEALQQSVEHFLFLVDVSTCSMSMYNVNYDYRCKPAEVDQSFLLACTQALA